MKQILITLFILLFATQLQAQSAQDIMNRASAAIYYPGADVRGDVLMTIVDGQGRKRSRSLVLLRRNEGAANADQQMYIYFTRPSDVNRTAFLVWKNTRGADDRWMYLPALDQVRRIAASDERTSFVGSHFFYEDVSGRLPNEDRHELVETNGTYHVMRSTPRKAGKVEFASYVTYIERNSMIPTRMEFYKADGTLYRLMEVLAVNTIQGVPTVTQIRMTDNDMGGNTTLRYRNVRYGNGFGSDLFSERSLRAPPMEYLR